MLILHLTSVVCSWTISLPNLCVRMSQLTLMTRRWAEQEENEKGSGQSEERACPKRTPGTADRQPHREKRHSPEKPLTLSPFRNLVVLWADGRSAGRFAMIYSGSHLGPQHSSPGFWRAAIYRSAGRGVGAAAQPWSLRGPTGRG